MNSSTPGLQVPKSALSLSISLLLGSLAAPQVLAQQQEDDAAGSREVEQVVVTGIRRTIQTALDAKRDSDVIIDGVSADDLGNFPDLNLGEALQRIPGIQIDRNAERRNASITARGLDGSFALMTVEGQSIASAAAPGRSPNPFGVFDSAIFSGANVVKSFTPSMQSGGLSVNVDLQIKSALERKDGGFTVRAESSYEGLTEEWTPGVFASGAKHFNDSNAGVYATVVWRGQDFRRDSLVFNGYSDLDSRALGPDGNTFDRSGFSEDAQILFVNEMRQNSEISKGDRLSASAGVEFSIGDNWRVLTDAIYTKRDLDEASNQLLRVGINDSRAQVQVLSDPVFVGEYNADESGDGSVEPAYIAHSILSVDPTIRASNRTFPFVEEVYAIYPQAVFENDQWKVRMVGTLSGSENTRAETLYNFTIRDASGRENTNLTNGVEASLFTGLGNYEDYGLNLTFPAGLPNFEDDIDGPVEAGNRVNAIFITQTPLMDLDTGSQAVNGDGNPLFVRNDLSILGTNTFVERELRSFVIDTDYKLDFGVIESISFGVQYKEEEADLEGYSNSLTGTQFDRVNNSVFTLNEVVRTGDAFFGGNVPNAELDNFASVDVDRIRELVLPLDPQAVRDARDNEGRRVSPLTGFIESPRSAQTQRDRNFTAERDNLELYAMANYNFEESHGVPIRGNFGLRYVDTSLAGRLDNPLVPGTPDSTGDYDEILPSFNFISEPAEDFLINFAYYKTFEALEMTEFSPRPTRVEEFEPGDDIDGDEGGDDLEVPGGQDEPANRVTINFAGLDVDPRTSEAFDLGFAWYNREGSILGANLFHKNVQGTTFRETLCPEEGITVEQAEITEIGGEITNLGTFTTGPLIVDEINLNRDGNRQCRLDDGFRGDELNQNRRISIGRTRTDPNTVTVQGVELQATQNLSFLDGWASGFGASLNFAYVDIQDSAGDDFDNVSPRTINLIGFYENATFSVRLAGNYRSGYSVTQSGTFVSGRRDVKERTQWDLSATYNPISSVTLRLQAFNITDEAREEFEFSTLIPRQYEYDGRTYTLSAQYAF